MNGKRLLPLVIALTLFHFTSQSQEFPIAAGNDTTFSGGAVFGGLNGLVAIHGDSYGENSITAQLLGDAGQLVGPRITLGASGIVPGAVPAFDGSRYFLAWLDFTSTFKGQFIETSGTLAGTPVTIATNLTYEHMPYGLIFGSSTYLALYVKTDGYLYGQLISTTGTLVGNPIQISSNYARDFSVAWDGPNFLVAWVEVIPDTDKDVYGQFVSSSGSLVGSNFLIDGGPNYSDNPTSLTFDGTRYLLGYHEMTPGTGKWTLVGRFISTSGSLEESITICDTSKSPNFASVASDGNAYLITWMQGSNGSLMGRFFTKSGVPIDTPFVALGPAGNKVPFGGVGFGGGLYLIVATKVDSTFSNGDVYGRFIQPLTGVADKGTTLPAGFRLDQNYPNPFNPSTRIAYTVGGVGNQESGFSDVRLVVYDVVGREVAVLVNEHKAPGTYSTQFDGTGLSSGVYFYRLTAGPNIQSRKMVLMK
jgi:hypothetical protein